MSLAMQKTLARYLCVWYADRYAVIGCKLLYIDGFRKDWHKPHETSYFGSPVRG